MKNGILLALSPWHTVNCLLQIRTLKALFNIEFRRWGKGGIKITYKYSKLNSKTRILPTFNVMKTTLGV